MAVSFAIQAADALAVAHASGIVHRDLKPANLLVVAGDQLKICDFGIAAALDGTRTIREPGHPIGTPAYMPPEQWDGRPADTRSDLYSLGRVLYEMLVGHPPLARNQPLTALCAQHVQAAPPPLRGLHPIPADLSDLVSWLLAKDPRDRPATAAIVATRLSRISSLLADRWHPSPLDDARGEERRPEPVRRGRHAAPPCPSLANSTSLTISRVISRTPSRLACCPNRPDSPPNSSWHVCWPWR
jgi:eukaryotic-like serine/threonine-protein kinase